MIKFKTFSKQITGLTAKSTNQNRDKLRQAAADFINQEVKAENLINVAESTHAASILTITVWYRSK